MVGQSECLRPPSDRPTARRLSSARAADSDQEVPQPLRSRRIRFEAGDTQHDRTGNDQDVFVIHRHPSFHPIYGRDRNLDDGWQVLGWGG